MHLRTEPLRLLGSGTWSDPNAQGDDRVAWKSGALVETITVLEEGGDEPRRISLAEAVKVKDLPEPLSVVSLDVEIVKETKTGRNGGTYSKDKWRCHAVHVVEASKLKAA